MRPAIALARLFIAVLRGRRAATAVEYGLILALIVIAMFFGLRNFANAANAMWNYVTREVIANA